MSVSTIISMLLKYVMNGLVAGLASYFVFSGRASTNDLMWMIGTTVIIYMLFDINCLSKAITEPSTPSSSSKRSSSMSYLDDTNDN